MNMVVHEPTIKKPTNSPMTESGKTPVWYKHVSNLDGDYKISVKDITIILKNPADEM